ncbi:MAG: hypothetical protein ACLT46_01825 [Hungatella sp.]
MPLVLTVVSLSEIKKEKQRNSPSTNDPESMAGRRTRVLSSAFQTVSASMTLEARLVFPLFLFAGLLMLMPLTILDQERQVQAVLER